jgi:hypothetical protein
MGRRPCPTEESGVQGRRKQNQPLGVSAGLDRSISLDLLEHNGYRRDPEWHPLSANERVFTEHYPQTGVEYFEAAQAESPAYYWRTTGNEEPDKP